MKILNQISILSGLICAFLAITFIAINRNLPISVIRIVPIIIFAFVLLFLLTQVLKLLLQKNIRTKLSALPLMFVTFMIAYLIIQLPVYDFIQSVLTGIEYNPNIDMSNFARTMNLLHIGVWISVSPMLISILITAKKSKTSIPKDTEDYLPAKGLIRSIEYSDMRINGVPVFEIDIEITHYGHIYPIKKNVLTHYLNVKVHDMIEVLIHPEKPKKVFIKIENNIY